MIASLWRYRVAEGREAEFESCYARGGDWAKLFARAPGYLGTELLRGTDSYLTIDCWADQASFDGFKAKFVEDYMALDTRCEALTVDEQPLGFFEQVEP